MSVATAIWVLLALSLASLTAWLWLALLRGMFWRTDVRLPDPSGDDGDRRKWPGVAALVPARNEAQVLPETLPTLLAQDYPGDLTIVVVDDDSEDGTADVARGLGAAAARGDLLTVVAGRPLPPGWSGKLWALQTALEAVEHSDCEFLLLTDADIAHPPDSVSRLADTAISTGSDLVSLMARLRTETVSDRLLLPAFVYFFAKLYPFRWSNHTGRATAAAAGGCILLRRTALENAGGLAPISDAVIDDCSLAALVKRSGSRIWLGLSEQVYSVRPYGSIGPIWDMVARTAYTQLRHSPVALAGTVAGMALLYAIPPLATAAALYLIAAGGTAVPLGIAAGAWALMAATFAPMLRLYGVNAAMAPTLPVAGALFTLFTVASAVRHVRGGAGSWRGRKLAVPHRHGS